MGDGSAKTVGLSLAQPTFVFLWDRLIGRNLQHADLPTRFEPRLFHFSWMLFSLES